MKSSAVFVDFKKGYVREHVRKGKTVGPYFTKRPPAKVDEKHLKEKFFDHSNASAKAAHSELEEKKKKHLELLDAAKKLHAELKAQGPPEKDDGPVTHAQKIAHLEAEIKNQETHIANHTRKQEHIKNRYEIDRKRIVAKKDKEALKKQNQNVDLNGHTDAQKKTIESIKVAHSSGKSKLEPGKVLNGPDKDHVYLETKHKETGKTHHIAIHKDGSIKDPNILHNGKFDSKTLKEQEKKKDIVANKPETDEKKLSGQDLIDHFTNKSKERTKQIKDFIAKNGEAQFSYKTDNGLTIMLHKSPKKVDIDKGYKYQLSVIGSDGKPNGDTRYKTYDEALKDASRTWKVDLSKVSVKNLKRVKKEEQKPKRKSIVAKKEQSKQKKDEIKWKGNVKLTDNEEKAIDEWISEEGNKKILSDNKSGKKTETIKSLETGLKKLKPYEGTVYRGIGNLTKDQLESIISGKEMNINFITSSSKNQKNAEDFLHKNMKKNEENYGVIFKISSNNGRDLQTYEGEVALLPTSKYRIKEVGEVKPYTYKSRTLSGGISNRKDKKAKVVEIEVEELTTNDLKKSLISQAKEILKQEQSEQLRKSIQKKAKNKRSKKRKQRLKK